jgi:hypothetical protein
MIEILAIGTNRPIMETISRLIDKDENWRATIAFSYEEACQICTEKDFKVALFGAGLTTAEENDLAELLHKLNPTLPIVKHYGGGSGLLYAEIYQAIG